MRSDDTWLDRQLAAEDRELDARARLLKERPMKEGPFSFSRRVDDHGRTWEVVWKLRQGRWVYLAKYDLRAGQMMGIGGLRHLAAVQLWHGRRELREYVKQQEGGW